MSAVLQDRRREADAAIELERYVLGAVLLDNSQLALMDIAPSDFSSRLHEQVFDAARRMIGRGEVTDAVTVADLLERETGRRDWLKITAYASTSCLAASNGPSYAQRVRLASVGRQAQLIAHSLAESAKAEPHAAVDTAIRSLMQLLSATASYSCHQYEAVQAAIDEMGEIEARGGFGGIRTGMRDLDEKLGGLHDEDLIVIGSRPAMGKTAFILNVAAAVEVAGGLISGEQGRAQIGMRSLAIQGRLSLHDMRRGQLREDEWDRVNRTVHRLKEQPIWIYDKPAPTIEDVKRQARVWRFEKGIRVLMVDYLQKLRGGEGKEKRLQVGDVAAQLKDLARELHIPVVALAQVNRDVESRPLGADGLGRMPYMSDLAESGVIEMEADQIGTLYRPEVYDDSPQYRGRAYFNTCKNRHGPTGFVEMAWRGEYLQFGDLAKTESAHD